MKKILLVTCLSVTLVSCAGQKNLAPVYRYGVNSGAGSLGVHVVQTGDSVWTVSQKYNLDLRGIIEANHLSPPYALKAGTRLNLPAPNTYKVRDRDNIYTVSRLFNTTQTELASRNRLAPPYKLTAGQVLKIPVSYDTSDAVENTPSPHMFSKIQTSPVAPAKVEAVALPQQTTPQKRSMPPQPQPASPVLSQPVKQVPAQAPAQTASISPDDVPAMAGKFLKPVNGRVISNYGTKTDGQHNDGINIQAMRGDAVRAAENGQVVYVGNEIEGYGNMILLRHKDQYMTAYAHMDKTLVKKGEIVKRGQAIGTVGSTGFVDKPQLHFEIRKGKKAVDPADLI